MFVVRRTLLIFVLVLVPDDNIGNEVCVCLLHRVLHSAIILEDTVYTEELIGRFEQLGLIEHVIAMNNDMQQVTLLAQRQFQPI